MAFSLKGLKRLFPKILIFEIFAGVMLVGAFPKPILNSICSENRDVYFMLGLHPMKAKG